MVQNDTRRYSFAEIGRINYQLWIHSPEELTLFTEQTRRRAG
jgi:hypothetical protein